MNVEVVGRRTIRCFFVLGCAIIAVLYLYFLLSDFYGVIAYLSPFQPENGGWVWHTDFARMWYVARRQLADYGISSTPPPVLGLDILAKSTQPQFAWLYPPTASLLAMPFAFLPVYWAFWAWRIGCLLFGYWLMRRAGLPRAAIILGLAGPASLDDLNNGQIGTFTSSLLLAGLLFAERYPRMAGICIGALAIKPQIAITVPIAWARRRFTAAYLVAGGTVLSLILLSFLLQGGPAWVRYFTIGLPDSLIVPKEPFSIITPIQGITVNYFLRSLGCSVYAAQVGQYFASIFALALVWLIWKQNLVPNKPRMILTVCLSVFATPYDYAYSLVGFSVAMMVLAIKLDGAPAFVASLLWLMSGYTMVLYSLTHLLLFPLAAAAGAVLAWHFRHAPALQ